LNAVEIEQAITGLAEQPFDAVTFPYAFLAAFGNKDTTIKRLRAGASNKSDLGGVLQTNNVHIATCESGQVPQTLEALKTSPATAKAKAKFVLATDGADFEAEDLTSGDTVACAFKDFPDHFGFFLPLAGISTVRQISENAFDIRATSRLNRLYVELLKDNPVWGKAERRHDMNHFMARLIFCFFAEDTDIFVGRGRFTEIVAQMSAKDSSNTHEVLSTLFLAMNTKPGADRAAAKIPRWADDFPHVNGGLFSGSVDVPKFSRIARSYLLHVGGLDWTKINPDIFGSMIQAVAEDEERGELGMHYTSVPNILKVLNPLFLDDLRAKLEEAGDNPRTLLNLRKRMSKIRVFDPACGSGNFLVIAYKEMRAIEAEINKRREETGHRSEIPLTNFRGIELRDFPAEIARLALVIAEYQCDELYRGQKLALAEFLPLRDENWITCGNALRLDWLSICPPTGIGVKLQADDLFNTPLDQAQIDFENEGGETYICGNPPFQSYSDRDKDQNAEIEAVFDGWGNIKRLDYIACWLKKSVDYINRVDAQAGLVSTNSICQGEQVSLLWPRLLQSGVEIFFAHQSFHWKNNAKGNAGVTCVIVGLAKKGRRKKTIYDAETSRDASNISPYLIDGANLVVSQRTESICNLPDMALGSSAIDGGNLVFERSEAEQIIARRPEAKEFIRPYVSGADIVKSSYRFCLWIEDHRVDDAVKIPEISEKVKACRKYRQGAGRDAKKAADVPHRFFYRKYQDKTAIAAPTTSSGRREYLPAALLDLGVVPSNGLQVSYDDPILVFSIISSKMHAVWMATTSARLRNDFRYSVNLTYFTFPLAMLTEKNKADLTRCAEDILLVREHHFPATIADLYDPDNMPDDLRAAHERNDEVLERIYIGRRFKNDTERLEKLFDLYTKMTNAAAPAKSNKRRAGANA
jgi:hypothetical protein